MSRAVGSGSAAPRATSAGLARRTALLGRVGVAILGTAALVTACGGPRLEGIGTSHAPRPERVVELSLRNTEGAVIELADQRGAPVLLFVLGTYDGVCQAALRPVSSFTRRHLDTVVLGIVAEPDAATFARLYEQTFTPPFTVTYDPSESITLGTSDLGAFEAVPTFYVIDAEGRIAARHVGWASEEQLDALLATAGGAEVSEALDAAAAR